MLLKADEQLSDGRHLSQLCDSISNSVVFECDKTRQLLLVKFPNSLLDVVTKDKVEEMARELADKGKLSEKEGKEFIDDLLKKSEKARKDFESRVEGLVQEAVTKLKVATRDDIDGLAARIGRLEKEHGEQGE